MHRHPDMLPWLVAVVALGVPLLLLALRQVVLGRLNAWRLVVWLAGLLLLLLAFWPSAHPWGHGDFRHHMLQHLLIGMVAPVALVLAAPVTVLLRSLPPAGGRALIRLLHTPPVRFLCRPPVALALNLGGMAALYFTPLYAAAMEAPALHHWMHLHFLLAGCLFAWVIAGPDPAPARPSVPARLVVLGAAIAFHAVMSQLLYAGIFVTVPVSAMERQGAAQLMYYGGDIAELLLAFALVSTWRPRRAGGDTAAAPALPGGAPVIGGTEFAKP